MVKELWLFPVVVLLMVSVVWEGVQVNKLKRENAGLVAITSQDVWIDRHNKDEQLNAFVCVSDLPSKRVMYPVWVGTEIYFPPSASCMESEEWDENSCCSSDPAEYSRYGARGFVKWNYEDDDNKITNSVIGSDGRGYNCGTDDAVAFQAAIDYASGKTAKFPIETCIGKAK